MPDAIAALPPRPLQARPPGQGAGLIWAVLGFLLFAGGLVGLALWVGPEIATDWQVRNSALPVKGGHLEHGSCSSKLFLHICDTTLTAPGGIRREMHYVFASFNISGFTAGVVADPAHKEWLTTDLGLDNFWDRVVTFVVAVLFLCAALFGFLLQQIKSWRHRRWWRQARVSPVALQLVGQQKVSGGRAWTVRTPDGATARWVVPRRAKPFVLGPPDRVLGLVAGTGAAMPLDAKLHWVDLTRRERQAALAAVG